jgi:hypothetical protein
MIGIADTKNVDTFRRKINAAINEVAAGYGTLPPAAESRDGALFVSGGTLYQNQLVADIPTWVAI